MILGCAAFAHRGLWTPDGPPENSIASFRAAAEAGCGIELDVQLSKDGVPVVFHDPALDRMTPASGPVWERTAEELCTLELCGSEERIPRLGEALAALPSGTPVLVELKPSPGPHEDYIAALDLALFGAGGEVAVMSFIRALNRAAGECLAPARLACSSRPRRRARPLSANDWTPRPFRLRAIQPCAMRKLKRPARSSARPRASRPGRSTAARLWKTPGVPARLRFSRGSRPRRCWPARPD